MRIMNRLVATLLLFGYVMMVPFCFFGGMLMANAHTMDMIGSPVHQMDGCTMPMAQCANSGAMGAFDVALHHVDMYLSISQTPFVALSLIVAMTLVFLFVVGTHRLLTVLVTQSAPRLFARRTDELRSRVRQQLLTWLSLFETSPNFA